MRQSKMKDEKILDLHKWVAKHIMEWERDTVEVLNQRAAYSRDKTEIEISETKPCWRDPKSGHRYIEFDGGLVFADDTILQVVRKMEKDGWLFAFWKWAGGGYFFTVLNILGKESATAGNNDLVTAILLTVKEAKDDESTK